MKDELIRIKVEKPACVEDLERLARCGADIELFIRPSLITGNVTRPSECKSFELCASYRAVAGEAAARFEVRYATGYRLCDPRKAAMAFLAANTRLTSDVRKLREAGAKVECEQGFCMEALAPGADLSIFAPLPPYEIVQFEILAGIGVPIYVTVTRKKTELSDGSIALAAEYRINCRELDYELTRSHGVIAEDGGNMEKALAVAEKRLAMDNRRLTNLGIRITERGSWDGREKEEEVPEEGCEEEGCGSCPGCGTGAPAEDAGGAHEPTEKKGVKLRVINGWGGEDRCCGCNPVKDKKAPLKLLVS